MNDANTPQSDKPLTGFRVLVTRPVNQADKLLELINASGGEACHVPVLDIKHSADKQQLDQYKKLLSEADLVIFISANAVEHAQGLFSVWPTSQAIAAVGQATAAALEACGHTAGIVPKYGFNSEALLAHAGLQDIEGKNIIIIKGVGGRELLGDTLKQRGARVAYADVYQRCLPGSDAIMSLKQCINDGVQAVTIHSRESLQNLYRLADPLTAESLRDIRHVVLSQRIAEAADEYAIRAPVIAAQQASDQAIVDELVSLATSSRDSL